MSEINRVVAHFADGVIAKGTTQDFYPNRPSFHLLPANGGPAVEVYCRQLKAMFFVKSPQGSAAQHNEPGFDTAQPARMQGKKIAVRFKDGELLCGYSLAYVPGREGFFITPADADSNNSRIYVISAYTTDVKVGPEADAFARKVLAEKAGATTRG